LERPPGFHAIVVIICLIRSLSPAVTSLVAGGYSAKISL
jgi:hypothetical protein